VPVHAYSSWFGTATFVLYRNSPVSASTPSNWYCGKAKTVNVPVNGAAKPETAIDSPNAISDGSSVEMHA
jgi:hypothetical protein